MEESMNTTSQKLAGAVRSVAWGFLLLYLDINLGRFNILPEWAGYLMIVLGALPVLAEEEESVRLLRIPGLLLAAWHLVLWLANIFGITVDIPVLEVIAMILNLYFLFQLLTNLASIAEQHGCPQQERLLKLRTIYTVLSVFFYFLQIWQLPDWMMVTIGVIYAFMALWLCAVLFSVKRSLSMEEE